MTNILVVDDSQFMRTVIGNALTDAGYEVETASDGHEAVDAVATLEPDIVTMDIEMPGMSGIDAVEHVMAHNPTPIVMLSAYTEDGADATLEALERGAVDFIHKPDGSDSRNLAHLVDSIVETVDDIADADVSAVALSRVVSATQSDVTSASAVSGSSSTTERPPRRPVSVGTRTDSDSTAEPSAPHRDTHANSSESMAVRETGTDPDTETGAGRTRSTVTTGVSPITTSFDGDGTYCDDPTIVVGASTGGPRILEEVLEALPVELGAKVVVVQHMPPGFTARFADRLDRLTPYRVREACDGDRVTAGDVVVARGGDHLAITNNVGGWLRVRFDDRERIHGVRPSIDVTMQTAAERITDPLVGVVLTGMGKDGADGIAAIKHAGGRTIAQDEATSPVFGIPRQAIETGCVDDVAPAGELVDRICDAFRTDTNGETNG